MWESVNQKSFEQIWPEVILMLSMKFIILTGLEKSTCPLVFRNTSGCQASENLDDFQCKLTLFS